MLFHLNIVIQQLLESVVSRMAAYDPKRIFVDM